MVDEIEFKSGWRGREGGEGGGEEGRKWGGGVGGGRVRTGAAGGVRRSGQRAELGSNPLKEGEGEATVAQLQALGSGLLLWRNLEGREKKK